MTFVRPEWFFLLLVIPLVVALGIFVRMRQRDHWKKIVAERLKKQLIQTRSASYYLIAMGLSMLGLAFLTTALAMPENGEEWVEARQEGRNVLICFDISQSMLTQDTASGSRLSAAKGAALEIVERFGSDRIGLLIFSGETQVMVPLTIDHSFLNESISQLDPIDLTLGGSDLARAVKDSTKILTETGQRNNILIVLSDGEDHSSGIDSAATSAASNGVFIYTLGFGSADGGYIEDPRSQDGFFYDRRGNRVISQLKEESLREIAHKTDGIYAKGLGENFLESLTQALARMDRYEQEGGHQRIAKPVYQWFLLPGLLLLMIAFVVQRLPIAPAVSIVVLLSFLSSSKTEANELLNIYKGNKASSSGNHSGAARLYEKAAGKAVGDRKARLHLAAGSSAYQNKDWSEAAASFSQALLAENEALRQQAHYALANTLFYEGRGKEKEKEVQIENWKGALGHYQESLKLGENKSTRENMEALKKIIARMEEPPEQQPEEEPKKNPEPEEDKKKEDEKTKEEEEKKDPQKNNPDQEEGDQKEGEKGENGQENQDQQSPPENPQEKEERANPTESDGSDSSDQTNPQNPQAETMEDPQKSETESAIEKIKPDETPEEHARRILNAQADFGGKPPKARPRSTIRPDKDW